MHKRDIKKKAQKKGMVMPPFKTEKIQQRVGLVLFAVGLIVLATEGIVIPLSETIKINGVTIGILLSCLGAIYLVEAS